MNVKYRILSVDETEHSIVVRYFTDKVSEDYLAIDKNTGNIARTSDGYPERCRTDYNINIFQTPSPNTEIIMDIIKNSAPSDWLNMQEQILDDTVDTSLGSAKSLLGETGIVNKPTTEEYIQSIDAEMAANT